MARSANCSEGKNHVVSYRRKFWKLIQYIPSWKQHFDTIIIGVEKYIYKKHNFLGFRLNQKGNQGERIIRLLGRKKQKKLWL